MLPLHVLVRFVIAFWLCVDVWIVCVRFVSVVGFMRSCFVFVMYRVMLCVVFVCWLCLCVLLYKHVLVVFVMCYVFLYGLQFCAGLCLRGSFSNKLFACFLLYNMFVLLYGLWFCAFRVFVCCFCFECVCVFGL